jgi:hypothetical protein
MRVGHAGVEMDFAQWDDDVLLVRVLVDELFRYEEAGDHESVARIQRELRDVIGRRVPSQSTVREASSKQRD